jgi:hypothetical protein
MLQTMACCYSTLHELIVCQLKPRGKIMNENKIIAYTGEFEVEDADFILIADRLIIRNEISFAMSGNDDSGKFNTSGVATIVDAGYYEASNVPLAYAGYNSGDIATVQFTEIRQIEKTMRCFVSGVWKQNHKSWKFSAILVRLPKP